MTRKKLNAQSFKGYEMILKLPTIFLKQLMLIKRSCNKRLPNLKTNLIHKSKNSTELPQLKTGLRCSKSLSCNYDTIALTLKTKTFKPDSNKRMKNSGLNLIDARTSLPCSPKKRISRSDS
jgi:hypothetical protein